MSRIRHLSRGRRASILAAFALLITLAVATSGTGYAGPPNAIKQFTASISPPGGSGQQQGTWTETVTNCGPGSPGPCTLSSVIAIGTIQIAVPTSPVNFQTNGITGLQVSAPSGPGTWSVSYSSGIIQAQTLQGVNKLQPGQSVQITFTATPPGCSIGTDTFTTSAFGGTSAPFTDKFTIGGPQPTIAINGCNLDPNQNATGPNGTNITNDSDVTVGVSFGGTLTCSSSQWASYHLPDEVNITPPASPGTNPKAFIFRFSDGWTGGFAAGATPPDSSFYLICYDNGSGGSILPRCNPGGDAEANPPPCVDQQYRDLATNKVTIRIVVPPEDPRAH